jgi:uncharacterized membrane protein
MNNFISTTYAHTLEGGSVDLSGVHHGFGMMGSHGFPMIFFGWILMFLFLAIVILTIVALIKYIKN